MYCTVPYDRVSTGHGHEGDLMESTTYFRVAFAHIPEDDSCSLHQ